jgi:hypothetical protein
VSISRVLCFMFYQCMRYLPVQDLMQAPGALPLQHFKFSTPNLGTDQLDTVMPGGNSVGARN